MINMKVFPGFTRGFRAKWAQILKPVAALMSALILASAAWAQPTVTTALLSGTGDVTSGPVTGTLISNTANVAGPTGVKPGLYF